MSKNPYPEFLIDEASGIEVPDIRHQIWEEGYRAGKEKVTIIMEVIKWQNEIVMVFDSRGEQIPVYQGRYEDMKESIIRDAPPQAKFFHGNWITGSREEAAREEW